MNEERMILKGNLATKREKKRELELLAQGHIITVRNKVSPFTDDLTELDTKTALTAMKALDKTIDELRKIDDDIKKLEDAVNG